jgi:uncharacterized protein YlbG (UPF0298 family)
MLALEITFEKGKTFDVDILLNEKKISYFHKFYENENRVTIYVYRNEYERIRKKLANQKYIQKIRINEIEELLI